MSSFKSIIKELEQSESKDLLDLFESLEEPDNMDWWESGDAQQYIWLLDISEEFESPIAFLGYNEIQLASGEVFIYIVKLYVLKEYRNYQNTNYIKLINEDKASTIVFKRVMSKGKSLITLESAHEKLDKYYKREFGFQYNEETSQKFSTVIDLRNREIMVYDKEQRNLKDKKELENLFG